MAFKMGAESPSLLKLIDVLMFYKGRCKAERSGYARISRSLPYIGSTCYVVWLLDDNCTGRGCNKKRSKSVFASTYCVEQTMSSKDLFVSYQAIWLDSFYIYRNGKLLRAATFKNNALKWCHVSIISTPCSDDMLIAWY